MNQTEEWFFHFRWLHLRDFQRPKQVKVKHFTRKKAQLGFPSLTLNTTALRYHLNLTSAGTHLVQRQNTRPSLQQPRSNPWPQRFQLLKTHLAVFLAAAVVTPTGWSVWLCGDLWETLWTSACTTPSWWSSSLSSEKRQLITLCVSEEAHGCLHPPQASSGS